MATTISSSIHIHSGAALMAIWSTGRPYRYRTLRIAAAAAAAAASWQQRHARPPCSAMQ